MKKNKILGCISLICFSPIAMAMQPMDDQSLSATTGQDGINIGIGINKVEFKQASLIDKDGIASSATYNNRASFVIANSNSATPVTLNFIGGNPASTFNIVADTDGGANNKAFANLAISFANQISGLTISPFSIYLAGTNSTSTPNSSKSIFTTETSSTLNNDVKELLRIGVDRNGVTHNIDINFPLQSGLPPIYNSPKMNIQLGDAPQGHMIQFGGAISSICNSGCPITLVSNYVDTQTSANSYSTGITFDLSLKASDQTNGFSLNGFYAGIESGGFVFGNKDKSSKFDASLSEVVFGKKDSASPPEAIGKDIIFNGIKNGPIGNIGAVGASVTDLKVKISGM